MAARVRQNVTGVSVAEIFNKWPDGLLHYIPGRVHFLSKMLETYTRPRGRCFLVSIKKFKTCIYRRKFLATTICHLTTENFIQSPVVAHIKKLISDPAFIAHFLSFSQLFLRNNCSLFSCYFFSW